LHEHFHQLQYSQSDYHAKVDALNLSGGDKTGMWMLDYPFPYGSTEVQKSIAHLGQTLQQTLISGKNVQSYLNERGKFQKLLKDADYKYFSFQLWQEGVARYTECKVAELAGAQYHPKEARNKILEQLQHLNLKEDRRVVFYPLGAGESLLLDEVNPNWRDRYFKEPFFLEKYFDSVVVRAFRPQSSGADETSIRNVKESR
jgi:hypothetical protein